MIYAAGPEYPRLPQPSWCWWGGAGHCLTNYHKTPEKPRRDTARIEVLSRGWSLTAPWGTGGTGHCGQFDSILIIIEKPEIIQQLICLKHSDQLKQSSGWRKSLLRWWCWPSLSIQWIEKAGHAGRWRWIQETHCWLLLSLLIVISWEIITRRITTWVCQCRQ